MLQIASSDRPESGVATDELISRVNAYLQRDDFAAARPLLEKLCELPPQSGRLHLIAGLVAARLEQFDSAQTHFARALEADPDNDDARYNLGLVRLAGGSFDEARLAFRRLLKKRPQDASLVNDIGVTWSEENRLPRALACFRRALRLDPNNSQARNNAMQICLEQRYRHTAERMLMHNKDAEGVSERSQAEISRWQELFDDLPSETGKKLVTVRRGREESPQPQGESPLRKRGRLAIFAVHRTFIDPIARRLDNAYDIRFFDSSDQSQSRMEALMAWADIAWFEWCDELIIRATVLPKKCRIVCRLHSYEAFTDMPSQVDWSKVDMLVFVNRSVQELTATRIPRTVRQAVISNGVDLDRFTLPQDKQRSHKIASVGYINYKKNPGLLLYCFKKIHEYDPSYSLHIAGTHQDARIALYFENFLKRHPLPIHFEGWVDDMPAWYADKGYVISTSLFESFHYSIAEGMASGLLPLVHDWYGADYLYPQEYLFSDPDDCLRLLKELEARDHATAIDMNRRYIEQHYAVNEKFEEIAAMLDQLLKQPQSSSRSATAS